MKMQKHADRESYDVIGPTVPMHSPTNGGQANVLNIFILHNTDMDYGIVTEDLSSYHNAVMLTATRWTNKHQYKIDQDKLRGI